MYHLKLCKGLSYSGHGVKASTSNPVIEVEDDVIYHSLMESGYFVKLEVPTEECKNDEEVELPVEDETPSALEKMTVSELKAYASKNGIDIQGVSKKDGIISRIEAEEQRAKEARDIIRA